MPMTFLRVPDKNVLIIIIIIIICIDVVLLKKVGKILRNRLNSNPEYKIAILEHKRNRKLDFFSVRSSGISPMNTKRGVFTHGFATRENTAFGVHSMK